MNKKRIGPDCLTHARTAGSSKLLVGQIALLFLVSSTMVLAQVIAQVSGPICQLEAQAMVSVYPGYMVGTLDKMKRDVHVEMATNGGVMDYVEWCKSESRCTDVPPRDLWLPSHPKYGEILLAFVGYQDRKLKSETDRYQIAQRQLYRCVALHMATGIKPKRKYQD